MQKMWDSWWRTFAHMDEYVSWVVIACAIGAMSFGGGVTAMILDRVANATVGCIAWVAIFVIALAVLFSVEYAGRFCECQSQRRK